MKKTTSKTIERPPVIAVMGHIDHGKSTLLDYIRETNIVDKEAGGITQHLSAYEVLHKTPAGLLKKITFLDTPGHAAFSGIRNRGASVADIGILVVSAEDGVKPQTLEALNSIKQVGIPYIVAISKIDKPEANIERTNQSLAENEIYVEGYGGDVPVVPISAKTGKGIPELLDMIILVADLGGFTGDSEASAEGVVIETSTDPKKGLGTTLIVKKGTLRKGSFIIAHKNFAPVRIMENFLGKPLAEAGIGSPVKIVGWDSLPPVGSTFTTVASKKEALHIIEELIQKEEKIKTEKKEPASPAPASGADLTVTIPLIIEADAAGSLEAILQEIAKISVERVKVKILQRGIGRVTEGDIKLASHDSKSIILNFNSKIDPAALALAERLKIEIHEFNIIYKMTEWLTDALKTLAPTIQVEESVAEAKILKVFSKDRDKQIIGGRVEKGTFPIGAQVKVLRRGIEIGRGKVRELQQQKLKASEVASPKEFGAMVESKMEIAPGDYLDAFIIVEKK